MAIIRNLKLKSNQNPESILQVHSDDSKVSVIISGWLGNVDTRYRFTKADSSCIAGENLILDVYRNQSIVGTITIYYSSNDGSNWFGQGTHDGLQVNVIHPLLQVSNIDEDFTIGRPDILLNDADLKLGSNKVHKVIFIDSSGSHTVFHEQLETPSYVSADVDHESITWTFKNEDDDLAVDVWARIGSNSFVEKQTNIAAGANFTLQFTGLDPSTAYNVDVYVKPASGTAKQDSEQATNTQTTTSTTKGWVYQGTTGSYYRTTDYYGNNAVCNFACTPAGGAAVLESAYPAANEPLGITGRTRNYNNEFPPVLCGYFYYEVEYV